MKRLVFVTSFLCLMLAVSASSFAAEGEQKNNESFSVLAHNRSHDHDHYRGHDRDRRDHKKRRHHRRRHRHDRVPNTYYNPLTSQCILSNGQWCWMATPIPRGQSCCCNPWRCDGIAW
ncbi:hypothetical protein ACFL2R_01190 [Patescibacteria group bacterium]